MEKKQKSIRVSSENHKEMIRLCSLKNLKYAKVEAFDSVITDLLKFKEQLLYYKAAFFKK